MKVCGSELQKWHTDKFQYKVLDIENFDFEADISYLFDEGTLIPIFPLISF